MSVYIDIWTYDPHSSTYSPTNQAISHTHSTFFKTNTHSFIILLLLVQFFILLLLFFKTIALLFYHHDHALIFKSKILDMNFFPNSNGKK